MNYDLMTRALAERIAALKAQLKQCPPSDVITVVEIQREIILLCKKVMEYTATME